MNIYLFICIKYVIKFLRKLKCLFNYFLVFFLDLFALLFFLTENGKDENDDKYHNADN